MDLDLVPVDDLIAEIDKRYDCLIIASLKVHGDDDIYDWHIKGQRMACIGLACCIADKLKNDISNTETGGFYGD